MPRVLFVYGDEPSGHASAARAIASALAGRAETVLVNLSADLHPVLGPALAQTYLQVIQKAPALWEYLYDNEAIASTVQDLRSLYGLLEGGKLRARIDEARPDAIVCTHALSFFTIANERERGWAPGPLIAAVTDFAVNTYWTRFPADRYLVPSESARRELEKRGQAATAAGIPIDPAFSKALEPGTARKALGLRAKGPVILLSGGSKALGPLDELVSLLLTRGKELQVLVACGSNAALREALEKSPDAGGRLRALPELPAEGMRDLLSAADIVVGKAGGLSCAEALAIGVPMILVNPIPGQEERNSEFLVKAGAALRASDLADAAKLVFALTGNRARLRALAAKAKRLGRPDSAGAAADAILEAIGRGET